MYINKKYLLLLDKITTQKTNGECISFDSLLSGNYDNSVIKSVVLNAMEDIHYGFDNIDSIVITKNEYNEDIIYWCTDCDWYGNELECGIDREVDKGSEKEIIYLICPVCGGICK